MELHEAVIDTSTDDGDMAMLVKRPAETGSWPVVLIFHDGPGIRMATHEFMRKLAGAGYTVITPDLYHRQGRLIGFEPEQRAADPSLNTTMWELLTSLTDDGIQHDFDRAVDAAGVGADASIAVLGFCLGARAVVRAVTRLPGRVVAGAAWHPSFLADDEPDSPHLTADSITTPMYFGIGEADQVQSIALHQRFLDAVAPLDHVEIETFPGADHGFTWPGYDSYDQAASDGCWTKTTALFERTLS